MTLHTDSDKDFQLESYDYQLPEHLIAHRPVEGRTSSRLLVYRAKSDQVSHHHFYELPEILPLESTLVLNQSRVFPCRLKGEKPTGGAAEMFVLSTDPTTVDGESCYPCLVRCRGKKRVGDEWFFPEGLKAQMVSRDDKVFWIRFNLSFEAFKDYLESKGQVPIPPYIRSGEADEKDKRDYQTVFAKDTGSVAAPTAGLHFTPELLETLEQRGVDIAKVTLHVGMGTFSPVTCEDIRAHRMHTENYYIPQSEWEKIQKAKKRVAVGTTSLRVLESSVNDEGDLRVEADRGLSTDIFLHPGKRVRSIKGLITNFHLPKSTLLMLVSSLVGREKTLELYQTAIENEYRFYSYGDAMCILLEE